MEEVSYEDDPDIREEEDMQTRDRENLEISHLRHQNRLLEQQLRSNEESNERLSDDLESMRRELNLLRAKSEKNQDQEDFAAYLRERNGFLEDLYGRTRLKYKGLKKSYKALQRESCSNLTSFDQDIESIHSHDNDQSFVLIERNEDLSDDGGTLGRLQRELTETRRETSALAEKLCKEIQLKEEYWSKHKETEAMIVLLKVDLAKKENLLTDFQSETNCKIDEAIQYIKLIENEFHLNTVLPSDLELTLEEKLDQFPIFIKKIYRDFVNLEFPTKRTDVSPAIKLCSAASEAETAPAPSEETKQSIIHGSLDLEKTDPLSKDDNNDPDISREERSDHGADVNEIMEDRESSAIPEAPMHIFKQRKLGVRGLMRTVSHDPSRIKERMLFLIFSLLEIENMFFGCGTTLLFVELHNIHYSEGFSRTPFI